MTRERNARLVENVLQSHPAIMKQKSVLILGSEHVLH